PPGGCRQRRANIAAIASPPANAATGAPWPSQVAQLTPIRAEIRLPPIIDQGWASGLAGAANSSTADAPIGAISQGLALPNTSRQSQPLNSNPSTAPTQLSTRSLRLTAMGAGQKPLIQPLMLCTIQRSPVPHHFRA